MTIKKLLLLAALLAPACVAARTTITVKPGKNAIQNAINKAANINDDVGLNSLAAPIAPTKPSN